MIRRARPRPVVSFLTRWRAVAGVARSSWLLLVAQSSFPSAAYWRTPVLLEASRVLRWRRCFASLALATRTRRDLDSRWRGRARRGLRGDARRRARPCD